MRAHKRLRFATEAATASCNVTDTIPAVTLLKGVSDVRIKGRWNAFAASGRPVDLSVIILTVVDPEVLQIPP